MKEEILHTWKNLCKDYTKDNNLVMSLFEQITNNYNNPKRYYHNLNHIYYLLKQANEHKEQLNNYSIICFAIFYHDIIYSTSKNNNEKKSAKIAAKKLNLLGVNSNDISTCANLIVSTKNHEIIESANNDNAFFLDFDLAILGQDWADYQKYCVQIRKEYSRFPNFLYKKGRKKALKHFLKRDKIFLTPLYYDKLESNARANIERELELL